MALFRSLLFAPANHPRKVEKVFDAGADAVILDLEDAVAIAEKPGARTSVIDALKLGHSCPAYVRVNAFDTPFCFADLQAVVREGLTGVVLPKLESAAQLQAVEWVIASLERERGLAEGSVDVMPIIETGKGLAGLAEIVAAPSRIRRLSFGAGDYTLDMNMFWSKAETELAHARSQIAMLSRAADLEPPVDTVFIHLGDIEALEHTIHLPKAMGFQGKLCIHPEQVEPVNRIFTPTQAEIAQAERYVEAFDEAEQAGSASIQVDGYFIDYPIVEKARRTLAIARAVAKAH